MNLKDLENLSKSTERESLDTINKKLRSVNFASEALQEKNRIKHPVDFSDPSKFAKFGSALKYYTDTISNIYSTYPYDGSRKEIQEWRNNASDLDLYFVDSLYPKSTGYINLGKNVESQGTERVSSTPQYQLFYGGPNEGETFKKSNIFDPMNYRGSNLALDFSKGNTVEFWFKDNVDKTNTDVYNARYCLFEVSNSSTVDKLTWISLGRDNQTKKFTFEAINNGQTTSEQYIDFNFTDFNNWHHYAFTFKLDDAGNLVIKFYLDGNFRSSVAFDGSYLWPANQNNLTGSIGATIDGRLPVSGSFDEFRFWKEERTELDIKQNMYNHVGGGVNTDDENITLGVYFKYNEGITSISDYDSVCLDYSGRISNGYIVNYDNNVRSVKSAMESHNSSITEPSDIIIYKNHPDVINLINNFQTSGSLYDYENANSLINTIPSWIIEQEEQDGTSEVKNLVQIMSSYLDNLHTQVEHLNKIRYTEYTEGKYNTYPLYSKFLGSYDFNVEDIFNQASFSELYLNKTDELNFETTLDEVKNQIFRNIYNNLSYIYKSKGTLKSFRNLLRCFGINENLLKLNIYANNAEYYFDDKTEEVPYSKKFINFNTERNFQSTIFLKKSNGDLAERAYIQKDLLSGVDTTYTLIPHTLEAEIILPEKFDKESELFFSTPFISSSIFGVHSVAGIYDADTDWLSGTDDAFNFQVYAVRPEQDSKNCKFVLTSLSQAFNNLYLETETFEDAYTNQKWNIAVKIKNTKYGSEDLENIPGSDYIIEFYGVNTHSDMILNTFYKSHTSSYNDTILALQKYKKVYLGAHRQNFTGSVLQYSDVKVSSLRYWLNDLSNETINNLAFDSSKNGIKNPYENAYSSISTLKNQEIPNSNTLILNWDFDKVSSSNFTGNFTVFDISSGSYNDNTYGRYSNMYNRIHNGYGYDFGINDSKVVSVEYLTTAKTKLPETVSSNEMIKTVEYDVVRTQKDVTPTDYSITIEKNMYQVISEDMMKLFSSIKDFNNLIGSPIDNNKESYKKLDYFKNVYFSKLENTPNLEKFIEFYKWIDSSIINMITSLLPASAKKQKILSNVIESHILERNKNKKNQAHGLVSNDWLKNFQIEGGQITNISLPYSEFKPPNSPAGNTWSQKRANRVNETLVSSGIPEVDRDREQLRKAIHYNNINHVYNAYNFDNAVVFDKNTDNIRILSKIFNVSAELDLRNNKNRSTIIREMISAYDSLLVKFTKNKFLKEKDLALMKQKTYSSIDNLEITNPDTILPFTTYKNLNTDEDYISNIHEDSYSDSNEIGLQGPFTDTFVGGSSHRHNFINQTKDRKELYKTDGISTVTEPDNTTGYFYRNTRIKRPLNILNIKNDNISNKVGNYSSNYEFISMNGKQENNLNFILSGGIGQEDYSFKYLELYSKDILSLQYTSGNYSLLSSGLKGIFFNSNGTSLFTAQSDATIRQYNLSTPWDLSSISFIQSYNINSEMLTDGINTNYPNDIFFSPSGHRMYIVCKNNLRIHQWNLSIPWDLSSRIYSNFADVGSLIIKPCGIFLSNDGKKIYIGNDNNNNVQLFDLKLNTEWEISSYDQTYYNNKNFDDNYHIESITMSNDGLSIYFVELTTQTLFRYDLNTAWGNVSLGTLESVTMYSVQGGIIPVVNSIFLRPYNKNLFVANNDTIYNLQQTVLETISYNNFTNKISLYTDKPVKESKKNDTVIVTKFSIPGAETSAKIARDLESEEYSVYNSVNNRNYKVRKYLDVWTSNTWSLGDKNIPSLHKVYKNTNYYYISSSTGPILSSNNDNGHIIFQIPRSDKQYSWISASILQKNTESGYLNNKIPNVDISPEYKFLINDEYTSSIPYQNYEKINFGDYYTVNTSSNTIIFKPTSNIPIHFLINNSNGPYGYPSWKQIRSGENILARTLRNNSRISIQNKDYNSVNTLGASSNFYVDPVVQINYPIKQTIIDKINNQIIEAYSEYDNLSASFANDLLVSEHIRYISRKNLYEYDKYKNFYTSFDSNFSLKEAEYKDRIFPRNENYTLLKIRQKPNFIESTGSTGYARSVAKIDTVWRDNISDRVRNDNSSLSAAGFLEQKSFGVELTYQASTVPLHKIFYRATPQNSSYETISVTVSTANTSSIFYLDSKVLIDSTNPFNFSSSVYGELIPYTEIETREMIKNDGSSLYYRGYAPTLQLFYINSHIKYKTVVIGYNGGAPITSSASRVGFMYIDQSKIINKDKPWYDSYENYMESFRPKSYLYSYVPEYRFEKVSDYFIKEKKANFNSIYNDSYLTLRGANQEFLSQNSSLNTTNIVKSFLLTDLKDFKGTKKLSLSVNGIKKLMPYKGFYPADRIVQLYNLFVNSWFGTEDDLEEAYGSVGYPPDDLTIKDKLLSLSQVLFSPGILLNSIKSGVAVDWASIITKTQPTSSLYSLVSNLKSTDIIKTMAITSYSYDGKNNYTGNVSEVILKANGVSTANSLDLLEPVVNMGYNYRFNFESLLELEKVFSSFLGESGTYNRWICYLNPSYYSYSVVSGSDRSSLIFPGYHFGHNTGSISAYILHSFKDKKYSLAMNNFLAEVPNFFINNSSLNYFKSAPQKDFKNAEAGKTYYMDVILSNGNSLTNEYNNNLLTYDKKNVFGPPTKAHSVTGAYFSNEYFADSIGNYSQAPHTPPYYYGDSIATIKFTPTDSRKYTLQEIFNLSRISFSNPQSVSNIEEAKSLLTNGIDKPYSYFKNTYTGSTAYSNKMNLDSSINLKQISSQKITQYDQLGRPVVLTDDVDEQLNSWVIQTKWECPYISTSATANFLREKGYTPEEYKKLKLSIAETPRKEEQTDEEYYASSGSLIELCGFIPGSKNLGEISESKEISEAIVLIPYTYNQNHSGKLPFAKTIPPVLGEDVYLQEEVEKINTPYYFAADLEKINSLCGIDIKNKFTTTDQIKNILASNPNINNSIIKTMKLMTEYNLPPNIDWVVNKQVKPFVMYIAEFKHTLDSEDLLNIWQNIMPKIATQEEYDSVTVEHNMGENEFFHGKTLPEDVRWKIFKVKKKANINYYELLNNSKDDNRFKFEFEKGTVVKPEYSYNWPYDYFSLVEMVNVDAEIKITDETPSDPKLFTKDQWYDVKTIYQSLEAEREFKEAERKRIETIYADLDKETRYNNLENETLYSSNDETTSLGAYAAASLTGADNLNSNMSWASLNTNGIGLNGSGGFGGMSVTTGMSGPGMGGRK